MEGKYLQLLLTITIPVLLILGAVLYGSTDYNFYLKEIEKGAINKDFVNEVKAQQIASETLLFLKGKGELTESLVGTNAKNHMQDVKDIRDISKYILYIAAVFFVIAVTVLCIIHKPFRISKALIHAAIIIFMLNGFLFVSSKFFFNIFWTKFHEAIFANNLWQLDPSTDALVAVFSQQFFIDFITQVVIITSLVAIILLIKGIYFHHFVWKEEKSQERSYELTIEPEEKKEDFQW